MGADEADAPPLRADRRQGAHGARASAQSLVARDAVRVGARTHDGPDAVRRPDGRDRARLRRPSRARAASDGRTRRVPAARPARVRALLRRAVRGAARRRRRRGIRAEPFDLGDSPPFPTTRCTTATTRTPSSASGRSSAARDAALATFRSRFNGKASPAHVFWHGFDLAHARFSGRRGAADRRAPTRSRAEAYSHEVIAFGWWPGDDRTTPVPGVLLVHRAGARTGCATGRSSPTSAAWRDSGQRLAGGRCRTTRSATAGDPAASCSRSTRAPTARARRPPAGTSSGSPPVASAGAPAAATGPVRRRRRSRAAPLGAVQRVVGWR